MPLTTARAGPAPDLRDRAHDLRNLFGVIASARHMLADGPDKTRQTALLDAIEDAAVRGAALTTRLLVDSRDGPDGHVERLDLAARLRLLEPLLRSIIDADHRLRIEIDQTPAIVRAASDRFDHVVLELVANARNALTRSGTIHIRLKSRGGKIRLLVADTGCGMTAEARRALRTAAPTAGAHGTGFQQIRRFARDAHGKLSLRSTAGRGTVVLLELPALLGVSAS
jgi:signal transduction histidine kinase